MRRAAFDKPGFVSLAADVSGGVLAAQKGRFVVVVDVIDMSTTLEAVREAGAVGCWGAAPTNTKMPDSIRQQTNPYLIGKTAARLARASGAQVVVISEPRAAEDEKRRETAAGVLAGIASEKAPLAGLLPNLGAETAKLTDWRNKIAIAVTAAGGTVFDAVWQAGGGLTTATVARTLKMKGHEPALKGIKRIMTLSAGRPLTLVAASSNALEDILAVRYLAQLIRENQGYLDW